LWSEDNENWLNGGFDQVVEKMNEEKDN